MQLIESIKKQIQSAINTQEKRYSAAITLLTTLIIITPLCGYLFQCGCDWPWQGLDTHCNFYNPHTKHQCPWCASMATGVLSVGISILAGVWSSTALLPAFYLRSFNPAVVRTFQGLLIFVSIAILTAGIAALYQGYSLGVGSYLR